MFAPVTRWGTIRSVFVAEAIRWWIVYQLDVKGIFVHGKLKIAYVKQPLIYLKNGEEIKFYRMNKALNGLKKAPKAWYNKIENEFKNEGL